MSRRYGAPGRLRPARRALSLGLLWSIAAVVFAVALALPQAGRAQERWHHDRDWRGHGDFHGRDFDRWRGGRWHHGWHDGRFGWWWIAPGFAWAYYTAPVYPYPDFAPPPPAPPPGPSVARILYYCANPPGYYPAVPQCFGPWRPVPVPVQ